MKFSDLFSWAGFTGIGGGLAPVVGAEALPGWTGKAQAAWYELSFGSKFLIAAGLTVIGLYAVKRMMK